MGINLHTIEIIRSWPDTDVIKVDGIYISAYKENKKLWAGFVYLVKGGDIHSLLLSTKPIFESDEAAMNSLKDVVSRIRKENNVKD